MRCGAALNAAPHVLCIVGLFNLSSNIILAVNAHAGMCECQAGKSKSRHASRSYVISTAIVVLLIPDFARGLLFPENDSAKSPAVSLCVISKSCIH